jgi:hypothetical protein
MKHIAKHWKILLGFEDTKGVIRSCKSKDRQMQSLWPKTLNTMRGKQRPEK